MNAQYAGSAYRNARETVGKTRQIVLLYEGVIKFVQQAKLAIEEKRIEDRHNALEQASTVVIGLQSSLDFDQGGDIARVLYSFYSEIQHLIDHAQRKNDAKSCDKIVAQLKSMLDSWRTIDQTSSAGQGTATLSNTVSAPAPAANTSQKPKDGQSAINFSA